MRSIAAHVGRLSEYLLKKPVADKPVAPYSPFLSDKETIGAFERSDELVSEQVSDILLNIRNGQAYAPEDFVTGMIPKAVGFAFYGERTDEDGHIVEQALLMRRGSSFPSGPAVRLYMASGDEVVSCDKPVLKFTTSVDFLLIGDACYFFSYAIEKDFALENRHFAIARKRMSVIAEVEIVDNYECLEEVVYGAKNAWKFVNFDKNILDHIVRWGAISCRENKGGTEI